MKHIKIKSLVSHVRQIFGTSIVNWNPQRKSYSYEILAEKHQLHTSIFYTFHNVEIII